MFYLHAFLQFLAIISPVASLNNWASLCPLCKGEQQGLHSVIFPLLFTLTFSLGGILVIREIYIYGDKHGWKFLDTWTLGVREIWVVAGNFTGTF